MNWIEAVEAMRVGKTVRRKSESWQRQLSDDIVESGEEGCRLMHAWTVEDKPALVFVGACSKAHFVPDDGHRSATDWEVEGAV